MHRWQAEPVSSAHRLADAVAICPPGLETVCSAELAALGLRPGRAAGGVVPFRGSSRAVYSANLWLRTATRILVRIARFRATDFAHLERRIGELDLGPYLGGGTAPRFRVTARRSGLFHTEAIVERLHRVVGPARQSDDEEEQIFVVRIERDSVTFSVDTTGEPLHKRSWRSEPVAASLRPTLAAGAVLLSGLEGVTEIVDPFAGAGTLVIEAGLIASGRPPDGRRRYRFHDWPSFEPGTWASVTGAAASRLERGAAGAPPRLVALDRDPTAVQRASSNAARIGIDLHCEVRTVGELPGHDGSGLVITNPPYGKRSSLGRRGAERLYRRLGTVVRERRPQSAMTVVAPGDLAVIDRRLRTLATVSNGGLTVRIAGFSPPG